jgi:hypothetical protein
MLDYHTDVGDGVIVLLRNDEERGPVLRGDAPPSRREECPGLREYASFVLEQQDGYCQLV